MVKQAIERTLTKWKFDMSSCIAFNNSTLAFTPQYLFLKASTLVKYFSSINTVSIF